jgi:UDP-GlcNAc:undecaprenyl-phosphate/decaprenyl-phosphate GlcNAc-1-phosphate transferase
MRDYALVFLVTAAVTYLLTPLVRRIAVRTHAMHEPRARDTHVQATPLLGGLAMYGGLVAGLLVASRLSFVQDPFQSAGSRSQAGLLLAGGLVVLVGFADDRWGLSAISRLAAQVAAAGILVWSGQALPWLPTPNGGVFSLEPDLSVTLTILIVVVTMNAINFIDGLDGLAAGIVAVAALSFLAYSYSLIMNIGSTSQSLPAVASALLAGMCIGFLPHNFYPARIFMGDIGAMLLGLLLAYGPISSTDSLDPALLTAYSRNHPLDRFPTFLPLLVPAAIFVIPYADLMFAVVRRAKAGKPLMAADRQHLHHRLLNIGHSYRQSVLLMYLWAALFSVTVVSLSIVRTPSVVFFAATLVAVLALLPVTMPRLRPWRARTPAKPRAAARPSAPVPPAHAAPAYAPPAQVPHAPATPSATAPSVPPLYAPVPPAPVPPAHATAAAVSDVPRFLPAAPSNGTNGTNGAGSSNGATPPGTGGFAGQARFQGQEPFPGPPVSHDRPAAPWEQVSPNRPAPWQDAYGDRGAAAPQGSLPGQDGFSGPGPYTGQSPFSGQPDPEDGALDGNDPFSQVQRPDAWPR